MLKVKKTIVKILRYALALAPAVLFTQYMFVHPDSILWDGEFPVVKLQVYGDTFSGVSAEETSDTISKMAFLWSNNGLSHFAFQATEIAGERPDTEMDSSSCNSSETTSSNETITMDVYAVSTPDPDCTASDCALLWSCQQSKKITKAEIRFNTSGFSFSSESAHARIDLAGQALHSLGHVAGLDHCHPGDTATGCSSQLDESEEKPGSGSAMQYLAGVYSISEDDKRGMQALYGTYDSPFPLEGRYALSISEMDSVAETIQFTNHNYQTSDQWNRVLSATNATLRRPARSQDEIRTAVQNDFQNHNTDNFYTQLDLNAALEAERSRAKQFYSNLSSSISQLPDGTLQAMRKNLSMGLTMNRLMGQKNDTLSALPDEYLAISEEKLTALRQLTIDELLTRGLLEE